MVAKCFISRFLTEKLGDRNFQDENVQRPLYKFGTSQITQQVFMGNIYTPEPNNMSYSFSQSA